MAYPAPFVGRLLKVEDQWVDYNGHFNMAYYNVLFDRAGDEAFAAVGLGPDYVKERKAFALWQKDARVSLIAADGTVLSLTIADRFADLPQVVGSGAERQSADFLALLSRYPVIARQVDAAVLVAERRWNLHLKNGLDVLLPENEPERALQTLANLDRDKRLLSRDIVVVDLRLADRVSVRQSDAAYAAREDALRAAAAKTAKKKGGDA